MEMTMINNKNAKMGKEVKNLWILRVPLTNNRLWWDALHSTHRSLSVDYIFIWVMLPSDLRTLQGTDDDGFCLWKILLKFFIWGKVKRKKVRWFLAHVWCKKMQFYWCKNWWNVLHARVWWWFYERVVIKGLKVRENLYG